MYHIRFRLGLCLIPRWGSLQLFTSRRKTGRRGNVSSDKLMFIERRLVSCSANQSIHCWPVRRVACAHP